MNSVKFYKPKDQVWTDASGISVPVKFVPQFDKRKEVLAAQLHKSAISLEKSMSDFFEQMNKAFDEISKSVRDQYEVKHKKPLKTKGSITWFNFDRSVKIEADVNEIVKWDHALMSSAKEQLDNYLKANMTEANELIAGLVSAAFSNSRGMIDTAKVFAILKYRDKIKAKPFQKACEMMVNAQSVDRSKLYMRIWEKQEDGKYRNINLNFSSI